MQGAATDKRPPRVITRVSMAPAPPPPAAATGTAAIEEIVATETETGVDRTETETGVDRTATATETAVIATEVIAAAVIATAVIATETVGAQLRLRLACAGAVRRKCP